MTVPTSHEPELTGSRDDQSGSPTPERGESVPARVIRALLTQRIVLLAVLWSSSSSTSWSWAPPTT